MNAKRECRFGLCRGGIFTFTRKKCHPPLTFSNIEIILKIKKLDIRDCIRKKVSPMPRERFKTLTEQMFYLLLCLREECRGMEILEKVRQMTDGRVSIGSGTLYDLLEQFTAEGWIEATGALRGRRRYRITEKGTAMLAKEYQRLQQQVRDYECHAGKETQP